MAEGTGTRRSYGQFCGLACALDVVGDRWTLLIVRELLVRPGRFRDLQARLPGIATNLLTERLRQMERDGLVERRLGDEPGDGTKYALTSRGEELRGVVHALMRWSVPLMAESRQMHQFRPDWLTLALPALLAARPPRRTRIGVETGGERFILEASRASVAATPGPTDRVDARIVADPALLLGMATGTLTLGQAVRRGARVTGDRAAVGRVFARPFGSATPSRAARSSPSTSTSSRSDVDAE